MTSVAFSGMHLPARMKKGTPLQRQLSISSSTAAKVSVVESGGDVLDLEEAVVLTADVALRVGLLEPP